MYPLPPHHQHPSPDGRFVTTDGLYNFKNSHNLEIESYVFFGGDFQDFKPRRQRLK